MAKQAERQFRLTRVMVLTSFSEHITEEQAQKLQAGDKMISAWRKVVDEGVSEQKRLDLKSSTPQASTPDKPNHLTSQSSAKQKKSSQASDHKQELKQRLQDRVSGIALEGISFLQASTTEPFSQRWQALIERERESFYQQFESYYLRSEESEWVLYFQNTIGIFFQPLPPLTQPWPAWWYGHAIQNRNLLFEAWCLSTLVDTLENNPLYITSAQKQHFLQWLQQEQIKTRENHQARWNWLDSFRYGLKQKYRYWELQLINYQNTLQSPTGSKEEKKEIVQQKSNSLTTEAKSQVSPTPSTSILPTHPPASTNLPQESCPLDLKVDSTAWQQYVESLKTMELSSKEMLCLTFLKTAMDRLQQSQMSLENPEHAAIFYAVTHLFWQQFSILKPHWLFNPLDTIHNTLDVKSEYSPSIKQRFFTLQAKLALEFASKKSEAVASSSTDSIMHTF